MAGQDLVSRSLASVLDEARALTGGELADYIPELAKVDPESLGLSLVSVMGHAYGAGDDEVTFTIQSVAKPFVYALALDDLGLDTVHAHVGMEPSGQPFNAISLDDGGRPANPMINAGAIVTSALIDGDGSTTRFGRIHATLEAFAGASLGFDQSVYESEARTGDRNRALAYLTRTGGSLVRDVDDAVDVYFKQSSILVTARDLATMGATLANGGVNPLSGQRVVSRDAARHTLSLMASCGMYDRSGAWMLQVGIPAKSGVGGGIVAVAPGQFGIGVFSPPLDSAGNSSRGVAALVSLSDRHGLHMLRRPAEPASPIVKLEIDSEHNVLIVLRGELHFLEAEMLAHDVASHLPDAPASIVLDLTSVTLVTDVARNLVAALAAGAAAASVAFALVDPQGLMKPD